MSNASQFFGGQPSVASIVNAQSSGGVAGASVWTSNAKQLAAASLVAGVLQTALSIPSGRGTLNIAHAQTSNGATKSIRIKVTVDGRVIFDASSSSGSTSPAITAIGHVVVGAANSLSPQPISFKNSLLVEVASSITEASGVTTFVNYEVNV